MITAQGAHVQLAGQDLYLVLTLEAMSQITEAFGSLDGMMTRMDEADYKEKLNLITQAAAILATQGLAIQDLPGGYTALWIRTHMLPRDMTTLVAAIKEAFRIGTQTQIASSDPVVVDVVLAENQKNGEGAAAMT